MTDQALAIRKIFSDGWKQAKAKFSFQNVSSTEKKDVTYVTEIDLYLEDFFISQLQRLFPNKEILSEEKENVANGLEIIHLDPLDGTHNFMFNSAPFGSMIAFQKGSDISFAAIYDPLRDLFYWSETGKGAYVENKRFSYNPDLQLNRATLLMEGKINQNFASITEKLLYKEKIFRSIRKYGCMLPPVTLAGSGWLHTICVINANPYDLYPAIGILKEAGFKILGLECNPWDINHDSSFIATVPEFVEQLKEILNSN